MSATKTIKAQLVACLNTVSAFEQVFGYFEPLPQEFPCAMVTMYKGGLNEAYTNTQNMIEKRFLIHIELRGKNTEAQEELRMDIVDAVVAALNSTTYAYDANNTTDIFAVEAVEPFNDDQGEHPKIGVDIIVSAKEIDSIP